MHICVCGGGGAGEAGFSLRSGRRQNLPAEKEVIAGRIWFCKSLRWSLFGVSKAVFFGLTNRHELPFLERSLHRWWSFSWYMINWLSVFLNKFVNNRWQSIWLRNVLMWISIGHRLADDSQYLLLKLIDCHRLSTPGLLGLLGLDWLHHTDYIILG